MQALRKRVKRGGEGEIVAPAATHGGLRLAFLDAAIRAL
jgi:hypothetical protein